MTKKKTRRDLSLKSFLMDEMWNVEMWNVEGTISL